MRRGGKLRARIFAPVCAGVHGPRLLAALINHATNEARARGYEFVVTNLAAADPSRAVFAPSKFYTIFLQKDVVPLPGARLPARGKPPLFRPGAFHDPRDIS